MKAIIDADHILWICLHGIKQLDDVGEPIKQDGKFVYNPKPFEQACAEADMYIRNQLDKVNATSYIGFIGGSSKPRKLINPTYKSNRINDKPDNFAALTHYITENWNIFYVNDAETDDYVASYALLQNAITISPDKDINALEGMHFNPKREEVYNISSVQESYAFWSSMIIGDASDGIKALSGKGPKYTEQILKNIDIFKDNMSTVIFNEYQNHFKNTDLAINEYYKTYNSLKIKKDIEITYALKEWSVL